MLDITRYICYYVNTSALTWAENQRPGGLMSTSTFRTFVLGIGSAITTSLVCAASAFAAPVNGTYGMIHAQTTDHSLHSTYRPPNTGVGAGVVNQDGELTCAGQPRLGCSAGSL